jgi:hypothetical protein
MTIRLSGKRTLGDLVKHICTGTAGKPISVSRLLNANNTEQFINCFQLFGTVELYRLYGFVSQATVINVCDEFYFDLFDGVTSVTVTGDNANLNDVGVDSYFLKLENSSEPLTVSRNTGCRVDESTESSVAFYHCTLTADQDRDTFVRLHYRTTDTPIDAELKIFAHWGALNGGRLVEV